MTARDEIRTIADHLCSSYAAQDFAACAQHFADDATFLGNGAPVVRGRSAIEGLLKETYASGVKAIRDVTPLDVIEAGDLVIDAGSEVFEVDMPDGTTVEVPFKYLAVWRRAADGRLQIIYDAPSGDIPLPG